MWTTVFYRLNFAIFAAIKSNRAAAAGKLDPAVKEKIGKLAKGHPLPGHEKIRAEASLLQKVKEQ
jgi:hypothetical protein